MKRIFLIISLLIFVFAGCTDKFEEYNTDVKNPAVVSGDALFSSAEKQLADYINNTNVNINIFKLMAQYWTETTYIDEANYDLITRNIPANIYSRMYLRVLKDLDEAAKVIGETVPIDADETQIKNNKLQIIEVLTVFSYAHLVDVFGAVPYDDALNIENVYPTYELGASIYPLLFDRLNAAIAGLDDSPLEIDATQASTGGSFGSADFFYTGDVSKWIKFANSLKLKMAITIADANTTLAEAQAEAAIAAGVFTSNDDDCLIAYASAAPNYNQLYADLVASGRKDFVPANTIVDMLNSLNDPRRDVYFSDQLDTSTVSGVEKLAYVGGTYGYSNSYNQCSHIGSAIERPDFKGIIMTYSEVCFYLAEAEERNFDVGGASAESFYNAGITASFEFWGATDLAAYLADPAVAYTTAAGDWHQKIGIQSWIANYTRGEVAYNNWRRLDFPILNLPEEATAYEDIPVRFTFPVNEQTLNQVNYEAASEAIGGDGDAITTKIFWDIF